MAKIAVISAEGVLCRQDRKDNTFQAFSPIPEGLALVGSLAHTYSIAVVADVTDADEVHTWMKTHGMAQFYSYALQRKPGMPEDRTERVLAQVDYLRSSFPVGLVVDSDPATIASLMVKGYCGLLFTHPQYARPEWRPDDDKGMRSWAAIAAEVQEQNRMKAEDGRLVAESDNFEVA